MADINVERKSSTAWIWWVLGLILLALLAWWLLAGDDEPEPAVVAEPVTVTQPAQPGIHPALNGRRAFVVTYGPGIRKT